MDLVSLVEELERQRNSLDLIINSSTLKAVPDSDEIRLAIPEYGEFPLTDWAHGQLADKLGIPRRCYERTCEAGKCELLAENINAWLPIRERRLMRILDGRMRAFLSDRYRIMGNYDLVFLSAR